VAARLLACLIGISLVALGCSSPSGELVDRERDHATTSTTDPDEQDEEEDEPFGPPSPATWTVPGCGWQGILHAEGVVVGWGASPAVCPTTVFDAISGVALWALPGPTSPTILVTDTQLVTLEPTGDGEGEVAAFDVRTGVEQWRSTVTGTPDEAPPAHTEGVIAFAVTADEGEAGGDAIDPDGSARREVVAFDRTTGSESWRAPTPGAAVVDASGEGAYVLSEDGRGDRTLSALGIADGTVRWSASVGIDAIDVFSDPSGVTVELASEVRSFDLQGNPTSVIDEALSVVDRRDGGLLAFGDGGYSIGLWDVADGSVQWSDGVDEPCCWDRDLGLVAVGELAGAWVVATENGAEVLAVVPPDVVQDVAVGDDFLFVLSTGTDDQELSAHSTAS
jgi:hypothetical protein